MNNSTGWFIFAYLMMLIAFLMGCYQIKDLKQELANCKAAPTMEIAMYQKLDSTNKQTIDLVYMLNQELHRKNDSLLLVTKR